MPSATQIRADSLARQAILSVTSALKAYPASSAATGFTAPGQDQGPPPSFQDAMRAAQNPPRQTADVTPPPEMPAADEDEPTSHEIAVQESEDADRSQVRTTNRTRVKNTDRQSDRDDSATDPSDPSAASTPDNAAAPPAPAAPPVAADGSSKNPRKTKDADPSAPSAATPADAAAAVSQQIVAAAPPTAAPSAAKNPAAATTADAATASAAPPSPPKQPSLASKQASEKEPTTNPKAEIKVEQAAEKHPENPAGDQQPAADDGPPPQQPPSLQTQIKPAPRIAQAGDTQPATSNPAPPAAPSATPALTPQAITAAASATIATAPAPIDNNAPKPPPTSTTAINTAGAATVSTTQDSADAAAPAQQLPADSQDQTFEQVVMGLRGKLDAQNGKAEIRLDPPNLGTLHVSISLNNGALTAQFQSSSEVVRDLLKDNMEKLKTVLQGQGIAVDKLAVESPADKVVTPGAKLPNAPSSNNDGRSAGQYTRDPSGQKRSPNNPGFAKLWRDNSSPPTKETPIDLVG